jgi:hypothetical protein
MARTMSCPISPDCPRWSAGNVPAGSRCPSNVPGCKWPLVLSGVFRYPHTPASQENSLQQSALVSHGPVAETQQMMSANPTLSVHTILPALPVISPQQSGFSKQGLRNGLQAQRPFFFFLLRVHRPEQQSDPLRHLPPVVFRPLAQVSPAASASRRRTAPVLAMAPASRPRRPRMRAKASKRRSSILATFRDLFATPVAGDSTDTIGCLCNAVNQVSNGDAG